MNELIVQETEQLKGLEESKAKQIKEIFDPMVKMLEGFESVYSEIMSKEISKEKCAEAKRLRLDISKIRIEADKKRKELKEEYLRAGNAIQGVYNILKFAVTDKEEKLKEVETYYERLEEEKIRALQAEREIELSKYEVDGSSMDLGKMDDLVWNNFLAGTKANYEAVKEAERRAEEERLAEIEAEKKQTYRRNKMYELGLKYNGDSFVYKDINFHWTDLLCMTDEDFEKALKGASERKEDIEKEEVAEQKKIRQENERLRIEAEEAEKKRIAEEKKQEAKLKAEREKAESERAKQEEALKKEREAREKLERETREKEAERLRLEKEEADRIKAEEEKAASAPDKEKLFSVAVKLRNTKTTVKSQVAVKALEDAALLLEKVAGGM